MWIGLLLICIGILVLLSNMDIIHGDVWNYIWPLALVFVGVSLIVKKSRKDHWHHFPDERKDNPDDRPGTPQA